MKNNKEPAEESLIEYPCLFPVKAMGENSDCFRQRVLAISAQHDPAFSPEKTIERISKKGNYVSMTVMINAINREQLDSIYRDLSASDLVKWAM